MSISPPLRTNLRPLLPVLLLLALVGSSFSAVAQRGGKKKNEQVPLRDTLREHVDELYLEGCTFMMQGESASAQAAFEDVLQLDPGNHASMFNIAQLSLERKSYDGVITQCKNAVALDPTNFWYQDLLRTAYQAKGDLKNAIKVQESILSRFDNDAVGLVKLAELQLAAGEAEKARFSLQASEQYRWEETEDLIRRKIALHQQLRAWDKVQQLAVRLIACDPENTEPYRIQYDTYLAMGLPDSAWGVLNTLLRSDRNHPFALLEQAKRWRSAGDNAQADTYMDRFATAYPEAPEAIVWKAQALKQQPASATSVAQARTLLAQNGRSLELWQLVFADDEARTDFAQLRSDAETGLEYFPNEMQVLLAFGIGSARTNNADDATFALEKVLKKADTPISLQARAAAELAVVYQQGGKTAEAKQTALRAQTLLDKLPAGDPVLPVCKQLLETFSGGN